MAQYIVVKKKNQKMIFSFLSRPNLQFCRSLFIYDIKERKFYCCVGEDWREYGEADFAEGPKEGIRDEGIYYFSTDRRDKFLEKPQLYMRRFKDCKKYRDKMYFRCDAEWGPRHRWRG